MLFASAHTELEDFNESEMYNTDHFILSITQAVTLILCIELAVFNLLECHY
jgi:hypothetical protein